MRSFISFRFRPPALHSIYFFPFPLYLFAIERRHTSLTLVDHTPAVASLATIQKEILPSGHRRPSSLANRATFTFVFLPLFPLSAHLGRRILIPTALASIKPLLPSFVRQAIVTYCFSLFHSSAHVLAQPFDDKLSYRAVARLSGLVPPLLPFCTSRASHISRHDLRLTPPHVYTPRLRFSLPDRGHAFDLRLSPDLTLATYATLPTQSTLLRLLHLPSYVIARYLLRMSQPESEVEVPSKLETSSWCDRLRTSQAVPVPERRPLQERTVPRGLVPQASHLSLDPILLLQPYHRLGSIWLTSYISQSTSACGTSFALQEGQIPLENGADKGHVRSAVAICQANFEVFPVLFDLIPYALSQKSLLQGRFYFRPPGFFKLLGPGCPLADKEMLLQLLALAGGD